MPTVERRVRELARGKTAKQCYAMAAFGEMGPVGVDLHGRVDRRAAARDRRVIRAWKAEAKRRERGA